MKIEKDTVTFEAPDADFVAKFGMQAAADMVLDFHCFHPQLPFLYDARQLAAFLSILTSLTTVDSFLEGGLKPNFGLRGKFSCFVRSEYIFFQPYTMGS